MMGIFHDVPAHLVGDGAVFLHNGENGFLKPGDPAFFEIFRVCVCRGSDRRSFGIGVCRGSDRRSFGVVVCCGSIGWSFGIGVCRGSIGRSFRFRVCFCRRCFVRSRIGFIRFRNLDRKSVV